jgi:adenosylcobinamide kinase/adenosylcobinamide-phosphate guanylyltransferase
VLILVTGGSRSGKSGFALELAERFDGPRIFLATAQPFDDEMARRISAHQRARPAGWVAREEPVRVPETLAAALQSARTVIVDCVTVWMANLLLGNEDFDEVAAADQAASLVSCVRAAEAGAESASGGATKSASGSATKSASGGAVIIVTNEVGSGIVPDNAISRRFRDCAGRANQVIARAADEVYFMVSGIPMRIKPRKVDGKHA